MIKKILFSLLAINLVFLQSYLVRFSLFSYPTNLQELLIGANALVLLLVLGPKKILLAFLKYRVLLGFLVLSGLSLFWVPILDSLEALRFVKFLFFGTLLALIFLETYSTEKARYKGLIYLSYGALAFGLFSVIYNVLGYNVMLDYRLAGPLDSAVYLAFYLVPAFLFFGFDLFQRPRRFSGWIPFLLTGTLLLATRSFGAMGAALFVFALFLFQHVHAPFLKTFWFKILALTLVVLFGFGVFYVKILPTLQTDYSSLDERGEIWETSIEILKDPSALFFGVGFGQFQIHYEQSVVATLGREPLDYKVLQPHNFFLLFLMNYGVLGFVFLLYLMGLTLWNLLGNKTQDRVQILALYVLLYFFVHGLIDTPFFKNDLLFLLLLFLELGVVNPSYSPKKPYLFRR